MIVGPSVRIAFLSAVSQAQVGGDASTSRCQSRLVADCRWNGFLASYPFDKLTPTSWEPRSQQSTPSTYEGYDWRGSMAPAGPRPGRPRISLGAASVARTRSRVCGALDASKVSGQPLRSWLPSLLRTASDRWKPSMGMRPAKMPAASSPASPAARQSLTCSSRSP